MINEQYKFAFVHIHKCGGTSIEKIFNDGEEKDPHFYGNTYKKRRPELYRWTCIRNTWDRMVSIYHYYIIRKHPHYSLNLDISFEEFIMRYIDENGDKYAYTEENSFFGRDGIMVFVLDHITKKSLIDFYVNIYNAKEHLEILFRHLNIDLNLIKKFGKHNTTQHDDYKTYYKKDKLIEAVNKRYKLEVDTFGFTFDNPMVFNTDLIGKNLKND